MRPQVKTGIGVGVGSSSSLSSPSTIVPLHVWDSEHLTIVTTTTTANDYSTGTNHDLNNPGAGSQPTFTAVNAAFNNLPTLNFNGTSNYLMKSHPNFLSGESSGEIHMVVSGVVAQRLLPFTSGDIAGLNYFVAGSQSSNDYGRLVNSPAFENEIGDSLLTAPNGLGKIVLSFASTGSVYRIFIDGVEKTVNMFLGTNDGKWFPSVPNRDNLAIGAILKSSNDYGNFTWAYTSIYPLLSDAFRTTLINGLKTKYGI